MDDGDQSKNQGVFFLAATNRADNIDAAFRRPGRLDREVELPVPSASERCQILRTLLPLTGIVEGLEGGISSAAVANVAANSHGMVGADLLLICKHAYLTAASRESASQPAADTSLGVGPLPTTPSVTDADLFLAAKAVRPSALREAAVEVPRVRWGDVGGMNALKAQLQEVSISCPTEERQA